MQYCVVCSGAFLGKTQNSRLMNSYSLHFSFACHVTVYGEKIYIILLQLKAFRSAFFLFSFFLLFVVLLGFYLRSRH